MNKKAELWEILVPVKTNEGVEIPIAEHKIWDTQVRQVCGGMTITKRVRGHWVSPNGTLFIEQMIPVRIMCSKEQIEQIIRLTLCYYNQEAVLAYRISDEVLLTFKEDSVNIDNKGA